MRSEIDQPCRTQRFASRMILRGPRPISFMSFPMSAKLGCVLGFFQDGLRLHCNILEYIESLVALSACLYAVCSKKPALPDAAPTGFIVRFHILLKRKPLLSFGNRYFSTSYVQPDAPERPSVKVAWQTYRKSHTCKEGRRSSSLMMVPTCFNIEAKLLIAFTTFKKSLASPGDEAAN